MSGHRMTSVCCKPVHEEQVANIRFDGTKRLGEWMSPSRFLIRFEDVVLDSGLFQF
jgi:hypothetical protein